MPLAPPANTVAPVASGTRGVGLSLSVTTGTWTGSPSFTYQWQRGSTLRGGGSFSNIGGATASSYVEVVADVGFDLRCVVTGTNPAGAVAANSNTLAAQTVSSILGSKLALLQDERGLSVSAIVDQSGNSRDFSQGTATFQPSVSTLGGRAALDYDGVDNYMERPATALSVYVPGIPFHVMVVLKADAISTNSGSAWLNDAAVADTSQFWGLHFRDNAGTRTAIGYLTDSGGVKSISASFAIGAASCVDWFQDGTNMNLQVDAGAAAAPVATGAAATKTGTLRVGLGSGATFFDGIIASVILCNAVMSAQQRTDVRAFLKNQYGVTT